MNFGKKSNRLTVFALVVMTAFVCLVTSGFAYCEVSGRDPEFVTLMRTLAKVQKMDATFVEIKTMAMLKKPLRRYGVLKYAAPAYIEKHITAPVNERYIANGDTITVQNIDKGRVRKFSLKRDPLLRVFVESLRATLSGNIDTLERFYKVRFTNGDQWSILLQPKQPRALKVIKTVDIEGRLNKIVKVTIIDPSGDKSVMSIFPEAK